MAKWNTHTDMSESFSVVVKNFQWVFHLNLSWLINIPLVSYQGNTL